MKKSKTKPYVSMNFAKFMHALFMYVHRGPYGLGNLLNKNLMNLKFQKYIMFILIHIRFHHFIFSSTYNLDLSL